MYSGLFACMLSDFLKYSCSDQIGVALSVPDINSTALNRFFCESSSNSIPYFKESKSSIWSPGCVFQIEDLDLGLEGNGTAYIKHGASKYLSV